MAYLSILKRGSKLEWLEKEHFSDAVNGDYKKKGNEFFIASFITNHEGQIEEQFSSYTLSFEGLMKENTKYKTFEEFKNKYEAIKENE